ncbi:hypothetical protein A3L04_08745 [Thermococcus chitonophagus]|uniref:Uncharacterized protein n=1 Tax=Thermococcus chitonophagus TaxID=54262 RepID=A0A160VSU5_9EURY|nr:hypothetical protein [Thermococcus chitonophagus]ASJ17150.1 hypothetical protein A3L04_08745 [Thermococcus chitonophagus]CUX77759.1 hypothetical protein CHITON_0980 [Thermococcus chitonophagus]
MIRELLLLILLYSFKLIISLFGFMVRIFLIPLKKTIDLPENRRKTIEALIEIVRYILAVILAVKISGILRAFLVFLGFNSGVSLGKRTIYSAHDISVLRKHREDKLLGPFAALSTVMTIVEVSIFVALTLASKVLTPSTTILHYWILGLAYGVAYLAVSYGNLGVLQRNSLFLLIFFGIKTGKAKAEEVSQRLSRKLPGLFLR